MFVAAECVCEGLLHSGGWERLWRPKFEDVEAFTYLCLLRLDSPSCQACGRNAGGGVKGRVRGLWVGSVRLGEPAVREERVWSVCVGVVVVVAEVRKGPECFVTMQT